MFNATLTTRRHLINCRTTCYIDQMGAWYDSRTKQEVMNLLILKQLQQAVGSFGLTGLDKLLSFMIVKELQVCLSTGLNRRDCVGPHS